MAYVPTLLVAVVYVVIAVITLRLLWRFVTAVERIADNLEKKN